MVHVQELGPEDVSLLERCPHFRGWYVQASMELGPEDVSLLERCPHFRGWYVQASMELGPEDVSLLERCPHFRGWYMYVQTSIPFAVFSIPTSFMHIVYIVGMNSTTFSVYGKPTLGGRGFSPCNVGYTCLMHAYTPYRQDVIV